MFQDEEGVKDGGNQEISTSLKQRKKGSDGRKL